MTVAKISTQQRQLDSKNLPEKVRFILESDFGSETNIQLARDFELTIGQLAEMTGLIGQIYRKELPVGEFEKKLQSAMHLDETKAKKLALEICAKRLLVCDEWFDGEASKKIAELGVKVEDYQDFVKQYLDAVEAEKETARLAIEDEEKAEEEKQKEIMEREMERATAFLKDPEAEKRSAKTVFGNYLVDILNSKNYYLKIELNARLITLLLDDEAEKVFQKELLDVMYENKEMLSDKKILLKNEKSEPTIGNWLRDFVGFMGIEAIANAIQRARYFTESPNVKALSAEQKKALEDLVKLFTAVKNFYENASKMDLADIYIFPFSDEEQQALLKELEARSVEENQTTAEAVGAPSAKKETDIMILYKDKPADRSKIEAEKQKLIQATRKEYDKVADWLENAIRLRKKHLTLACLEILAEVGALDNLISADKRYQELLLGYYKRNNLTAEAVSFKKNPSDAKYVQDFLRFIYLERLGLDEAEGARLAANMSGIFRSKGMNEYGQLAYLDLADNEFKWGS